MEVPLLITDFLRRATTLYTDKTGVVDGDRRFTIASSSNACIASPMRCAASG